MATETDAARVATARHGAATGVAGWLAVVVGAGHLVLSFPFRSAEWADLLGAGLWNTVTLDPGPSDLAGTEAYWFTAGSFALPVLLLGAHVLWATRHGVALPRWLGWPVLAWGLLFWLPIPATPGVLVPVAGVLLLVGARRGPDVPAPERGTAA